MNPERSGVCSGSATPSLPLLCFVVLNLCPPGSVTGLLFLFSVGISVSILSVCYLVSVPVFLCLCLSLILAFLLLALSSWFLLGAEPEGTKSSVGKEVEVGSGQRFLMVSQAAMNLSPPTISLLGSPWD